MSLDPIYMMFFKQESSDKQTDKQTNKHTDAAERIISPASRLIKMPKSCGTGTFTIETSITYKYVWKVVWLSLEPLSISIFLFLSYKSSDKTAQYSLCIDDNICHFTII